MDKLSRIVPRLRTALQTIRRNGSSHSSVKAAESSSENTFVSKWWDNKPLFEEKFIYRNNYTTGGWQTSKKQLLMAEALGGAFWFWVFWHCFYDYGHIVGHFFPPDPSQWSDEELGIPPDDVE